MASRGEPVPFAAFKTFSSEDNEWQSSDIRGFNFEDEDPFQELSKYQSVAAEPGVGAGVEFGGGGGSVVVSDRVRAASAAYAAHLDRPDRPGVSISEGLSEIVPSSASDPIPQCNDVRTLRSELVQARRNLEKIQLARYVPLHPKETVKNIFLGRLFSLEFYKSWSDKLALLEEAVAIGDGNVILTVVLFLRDTLSRSKLAEILSLSPPEVVNQLAAYLEKRDKLSGLADLYASLGRANDSALVHYRNEVFGRKGAAASASVESKIRRLKAVLSSHFPDSHPDAPHLVEHIHLLERASPVAAVQIPSPEGARGRGGPTLNLEEVTVHDLLEFCSYHHFAATENLLHSPLAIKKFHKLVDRQFVWPALKGRAAKSAWKDCQDLVLSKGWFGGNKVKTDVDPLDVSKLLHGLGAPANVLRTYVGLVEPLEERERYAKKFGAHTVVVDVYVAQRDRQAVVAYKSRLIPQTEEWYYADNALNLGSTKWKN